MSGYALDALSWANAEGIVNGTSAITLTPQGDATLAQTADMLMRMVTGLLEAEAAASGGHI